MRVLVVAATLTSIVIVTSCSESNQKPQPVREADVAAIEAASAALGKAFIAGDVDGFAEVYADDIVLLPPNRPVMVGKEAALEWSRRLYEGFAVEQFSGTTEELVVDGDWAFARTSFTWTLQPKAGGEAVRDTAKSIVLWHFESDGSWKRARVAWNSDMPETAAHPERETMTEDAKAVARRAVEAWNGSDPAAWDEVLAPEYVRHLTIGDFDLSQWKELHPKVRSAFPDGRLTIEDIVAEGDKVVLRVTFEGTHKGDFLGLPATGKQVRTPAFFMMRVADGKVVEEWGLDDGVEMRRQLGLL